MLVTPRKTFNQLHTSCTNHGTRRSSNKARLPPRAARENDVQVVDDLPENNHPLLYQLHHWVRSVREQHGSFVNRVAQALRVPMRHPELQLQTAGLPTAMFAPAVSSVPSWMPASNPSGSTKPHAVVRGDASASALASTSATRTSTHPALHPVSAPSEDDDADDLPSHMWDAGGLPLREDVEHGEGLVLDSDQESECEHMADDDHVWQVHNSEAEDMAAPEDGGQAPPDKQAVQGSAPLAGAPRSSPSADSASDSDSEGAAAPLSPDMQRVAMAVRLLSRAAANNANLAKALHNSRVLGSRDGEESGSEEASAGDAVLLLPTRFFGLAPIEPEQLQAALSLLADARAKHASEVTLEDLIEAATLLPQQGLDGWSQEDEAMSSGGSMTQGPAEGGVALGSLDAELLESLIAGARGQAAAESPTATERRATDSS